MLRNGDGIVVGIAVAAEVTPHLVPVPARSPLRSLVPAALTGAVVADVSPKKVKAQTVSFSYVSVFISQ